MSHILHFYHLVALDYVKGPGTEPFIPRYEGDYRLDPKINKVAVDQYIKALDIQTEMSPNGCSFWREGTSCLWDGSWRGDRGSNC